MSKDMSFGMEEASRHIDTFTVEACDGISLGNRCRRLCFSANALSNSMKKVSLIFNKRDTFFIEYLLYLYKKGVIPSHGFIYISFAGNLPRGMHAVNRNIDIS